MARSKFSFSKASQLGCEQLEARELLAGVCAPAPAAAAGKSVPALVASAVAGAKAAVAKASAAHSETHLTAALADPSGASAATGTVKYETETEHGVTESEFTICIKGGTAGDVLPVTIDGAAAGSITIGADGTGKLAYKANSKGTTFPTDFPTVGPKSVILVGTLTGLLDTPVKGSGGHDHGHEETETRLTAALADPTGVSLLTGTAKFESETEHGLAVTEFSVCISGGTPKDVLDVFVDGVSVGTITVGDNGKGSLSLSSNPHGKSQQQLPANFPTTVGPDSVITVGAATGKLAAPTPPAKSRR